MSNVEIVAQALCNAATEMGRAALEGTKYENGNCEVRYFMKDAQRVIDKLDLGSTIPDRGSAVDVNPALDAR